MSLIVNDPLTMIFETSNSFSQLSDHATTPESEISFSYPVATSSPTRQLPDKDTRKRKDLPIRKVVMNCQSIKTSGKPAQLLNLISSLQADVIIGSESWLNPGIKSLEIFPDNFKCFQRGSRDRPNGAGGGVFLLVSQELESSEPEELRVGSGTDCEVAWAKVKVKGSGDLYIRSFYRPPDKTSPDYLQRLQSRLSRIPTDKGAHLWIGGDFNLHDINWEEETVLPYATSATVSNQMLTLAKDHYLDQMITEPTRITKTAANTLELFFTSNPTLINKVETIPGISDHEAVFIESSLRPMKVKIPPRKVFQ